MIYCCEDCGFLFSRVGPVETCPSCEGEHFRAATMEEATQLQSILKKNAEEQAKDSCKVARLG